MKVEEYLCENYARELTIEDLCRVANLSPRRLEQIFRQFKGETPWKALQKVRLAAAQEMLQKGCSIKDTAYSSGFAHPEYFARVFKRMVGCSPSEYQETERWGPPNSPARAASAAGLQSAV